MSYSKGKVYECPHCNNKLLVHTHDESFIGFVKHVWKSFATVCCIEEPDKYTIYNPNYQPNPQDYYNVKYVSEDDQTNFFAKNRAFYDSRLRSCKLQPVEKRDTHCSKGDLNVFEFNDIKHCNSCSEAGPCQFCCLAARDLNAVVKKSRPVKTQKDHEEFEKQIQSMLRKKSLHIHNVILPSGVKPDDPRLKNAKLISRKVYYTDKYEPPKNDFVYAIDESYQ